MKTFRRIFLCFLLLQLTTAGKADGIHGSSGHTIGKLEFGYTNFRPRGINSMVDSGFGEFSTLTTFGFGFTGDVGTGAGHDFDGTFALHFYLPYRIEAFAGYQHIYARGWEVMTSLYGFDVLRSVNAVDLVIAPGVYWGELKITHHASFMKYRDDRYDNPFIAPMVRGELRFNISRLSIGERASYRYDITNGKWKRKSDNMTELPAYKFRELQYMFYIGWNFAGN